MTRCWSNSVISLSQSYLVTVLTVMTSSFNSRLSIEADSPDVSGFSERDIFVRSTDIDRTLMSAYSNLAGLYPPTGNQIWNPEIRKSSLVRSCFEGDAKSANWFRAICQLILFDQKVNKVPSV